MHHHFKVTYTITPDARTSSRFYHQCNVFMPATNAICCWKCFLFSSIHEGLLHQAELDISTLSHSHFASDTRRKLLIDNFIKPPLKSRYHIFERKWSNLTSSKYLARCGILFPFFFFLLFSPHLNLTMTRFCRVCSFKGGGILRILADDITL